MMARKGPGKAHRQGLTVIELLKMFSDDATAEQWFEEQRWPDGRFCPDCGSTNTVAVKNRKPMPYRCRDCRGHFSVRKGTVMQSSKVGFQKWAIALYMMTTGLKGTSSMKVYRELGIRQGTAWFLMQRIREGYVEGSGRPFPGPVEVDETYFGGERRNMSKAKRKAMNKSRGPVGKTAVVGAKDRDSNEVRAEVVHRTDGSTLQGFVREHTKAGAAVYTDDAAAYRGMSEFDHEAVNHTVAEYVRGDAHTNGIESFWSMLKRAHKGTFHKISPKHLDRYVTEFSGRHNVRDRDTVDQMSGLARGMVGKRLTYRDLVSE